MELHGRQPDVAGHLLPASTWFTNTPTALTNGGSAATISRARAVDAPGLPGQNTTRSPPAKLRRQHGSRGVVTPQL